MACVRVFIFSAAFPFFNNVDEAAHFDLVLKYSHGQVPHSLDLMLEESARHYAQNCSYEYSTDMGKTYRPIKYKSARHEEQKRFDETVARVSLIQNHESSQAPLYYAIAGMWTNFGKILGLHGASLLYWIRFLNVLFIFCLVWLSSRVSSALFPHSVFLIYSLPMLVALLPQDTYYSIQNDTLSPLCFALTLVLMINYLKAETPTLNQSIFLGLSVAATVLVKVSNIPLLFVVLVFLMFKIRKLYLTGKLKLASISLLLLFLCMFIPILVWFLWNLNTFGDLTGSEHKIRSMGWSYKHLADWLHHPIFTVNGLYIFWHHLMITFWRGEIIWQGKPVVIPGVDTFYWLSSLVCITLAITLIKRKLEPFQRHILAFSFWSFISLVLFMVVLSMSFDFGNCTYPSRETPFFTSGRLISAALIPFLILYSLGLNWLLFRIKSDRLRLLVLGVILIAISCSEILVTRPVFSSGYNWFHL